MDADQVEQLAEQFLTEHFLGSIGEVATESYRDLLLQIPKGLRRHHREKRGFEKRLLARWAAPLDLLEGRVKF